MDIGIMSNTNQWGSHPLQELTRYSDAFTVVLIMLLSINNNTVIQVINLQCMNMT